MPRGDNPNSRANLNRSSIKARKNGKKGGLKSGEVRRSYANAREAFLAATTDEKYLEWFQKLDDMFLKYGNLGAFDRIMKTLEAAEQKEEKSSSGGNIIFMPERSDGDE